MAGGLWAVAVAVLVAEVQHLVELVASTSESELLIIMLNYCFIRSSDH